MEAATKFVHLIFPKFGLNEDEARLDFRLPSVFADGPDTGPKATRVTTRQIPSVVLTELNFWCVKAQEVWLQDHDFELSFI